MDYINISAALATLRSGSAVTLCGDGLAFLLQPVDAPVDFIDDQAAFLTSNRFAGTLDKVDPDLQGDAPLVLNGGVSFDADFLTAGLALLKAAHLVPLARIAEGTTGAPRVSLKEALRFCTEAPDMHFSHEVRMPTAESDTARALLFTDGFDSKREHLALVTGTPDGNPPLVRVHSKCLTGDVFGSLRCDCGEQLATSKQLLADAPYGVLVYLDQEGRGIGLRNKLSAYNLQDEGLDTFQANHQLGYESDERTYGAAAAILEHLAIDQVRLLTNNPDKIEQLSADIKIVERVGLTASSEPNREAYILAKKNSGHLL